MKNICLFSLFFIAGLQFAYAQYPIPSYNAIVNEKAAFRESGSSGIQPYCRINIDKKRIINVELHGAKGQLSDVIVYAYSLDHQSILGPYPLYPNQVLQIEIDEREWGILVESGTEVVVDVWIDE
jgi:hypothetical protein